MNAPAFSPRPVLRAGLSPLSSRLLFAKSRLAAVRALRVKRSFKPALVAGGALTLPSSASLQ